MTSTDLYQVPGGSSPRRGTTAVMILAGVAAAAAVTAIGVLVAALPARPGSAPSTTPGTTPSTAAPVEVVPATAHTTPAPHTGTPRTTDPGTTAVGPQIVQFKVTQQPRCPEGTAVVRAPSVPVRISWKVTGAGGVALSVDNPDLVGAYGNYETEGSLEFTFSCGGPIGSTETHTYTINTFGGPGSHQRAQLTASAKVMDAGIRSAG